MTSSATPQEAYVWVWLPGHVDPVVAGRLFAIENTYRFNYGRSYLARSDAISIYEPELPLRRGELPLPDGLTMPSSLRDAAPDAWGRRVLINKLTGQRGADIDPASLDELTYLLQSGSDRIGALDFQNSATEYVPRSAEPTALEELMDAARRIEDGIPLTEELGRVLLHGSSIGGARPKATIEGEGVKYIAKFPARNDVYSVVKAEYIAMRLAAQCGLDVAPVKWTRSAGQDVILVERFDRVCAGSDWQRKSMVSALTILSLDEMMARYASYQDLADVIRHRFVQPRETLRELFGRIVFNILCGNTDDHARNHAAFWDGQRLSLTPAYDICPQGRNGNEASQAMLIMEGRRDSRLVTCLEAAPIFLVEPGDALAIVRGQIEAIRSGWDAICNEADVSEVDRRVFWGRQFLNPYAFEGAPDAIQHLTVAAR